MSEPEENPEDVQVRENEKRKLKSGEFQVTIANQTVLDQQKVWDEIRTEIRDRYEALNIPFDPSSITTKSEMEHHVAVLKTLEKGVSEFRTEQDYKGPSHGTPLTGSQTGEGIDNSGPISERQYPSEEALIRDLEKEGSEESKKYLKELSRKMHKKGGIDVEFQGDLSKVAGKVDRIEDKGKTKEQIEAERRAEEKKFKETD